MCASHCNLCSPATPKISLVWASELAHDYNDGLFHVDGFMFEYFRKNEEHVGIFSLDPPVDKTSPFRFFSSTIRLSSSWAITESDGERWETSNPDRKVIENEFPPLTAVFSQVRQTFIGQREVNNPMMYVSVPANMRSVRKKKWEKSNLWDWLQR